MATVDTKCTSGSSSNFTEYSDPSIHDKLSSEDVYFWQTDDDWEDFLEECQFLSEETKKLFKSLLMQETFIDMEDKDIHQQERVYKKRFLKEFPKKKQELEEYIAQLHALIDKADKLYRNCTISNKVALSSFIVSGVMVVAGLSLAPMTAGISLSLISAGMGLGAVSAATGVTTSIMKHTGMKSIDSDANKLTSDKANLVEFLKELINAHPRLAVQAMRLIKSGTSTVQRGTLMNDFRVIWSLQAPKLVGMATAGLLLLIDTYSAVKESTIFQERANTESVERLRKQASELEKILENLNEIYMILIED